MISRFAIAAAGFLVASCGEAPQQADIMISDGWARPTAAGQTGSAVYFTMNNSGGPDRLVSVSSPAAQASLHSSSLDGSVARMRPSDGIDVPSGSNVTLEPGGDHVMLTGLQSPLVEGTSLQLVLQFERSGQLAMEFPVRSRRQDR